MSEYQTQGYNKEKINLDAVSHSCLLGLTVLDGVLRRALKSK